MPRCLHCGHEFAVSHGVNCPSCKKDWRGPPESPSGSRPAHLALLDGPPDLKEAIAKGRTEPKRRLISSAGPAVPVMKTQNDSVPNGWMARLEAARVVATQSLTAENPEPKPVPPPPPPTNKPPPLEKKKKKKNELTKKPAHLLVAQLQEDEQKRRERETAQLDTLFKAENPDAISSMEIAVPDEVKRKKRIPDWAVVLILALIVGGGLYAAYRRVQKEPAPVVKVDPKLKEAAEKRKAAVTALEQGHVLVTQNGKADEAIAAYKQALAVEPTLAAAERGLAIAYTSKNDDATAVVHYTRYLELDPAAKDADEVKRIITAYEKKVERDKIEAAKRKIAAEKAAKAAAKVAAEKAAIQAAQKAQADKIRNARKARLDPELEKITDDLINE
jgi:tetratricopeptide (TPR) repeat protein